MEMVFLMGYTSSYQGGKKKRGEITILQTDFHILYIPAESVPATQCII